MTATVWVALRVDNDDLAAGPFSSRPEVERVMQTDEFDDVYPAQVDRDWFEQRRRELADAAPLNGPHALSCPVHTDPDPDGINDCSCYETGVSV